MGRKTWDSLGRPLPGRLNIVVSRQVDLQLEGAEVYPSLEAAVVRAQEWANGQGVDEVMLIGGAQLYAQGLAQADRYGAYGVEREWFYHRWGDHQPDHATDG